MDDDDDECDDYDDTLPSSFSSFVLHFTTRSRMRSTALFHSCELVRINEAANSEVESCADDVVVEVDDVDDDVVVMLDDDDAFIVVVVVDIDDDVEVVLLFLTGVSREDAEEEDVDEDEDGTVDFFDCVAAVEDVVVVTFEVVDVCVGACDEVTDDDDGCGDDV